MSIWDNVRAIEVDRNENKVFGIKSAIIWGHSANSNSVFPLLYLRKPKGITQEEYDELIDSIAIQFVKK